MSAGSLMKTSVIHAPTARLNSARSAPVNGISFAARVEPLDHSSISTGCPVRTRGSPAATRSTYPP